MSASSLTLDLSNNRFIHLKKWLPRTCDALVLGGMKETILEIIFQLYDIRKFVDHESLRDVMDTLHDINMNPKVYRAWFLLSENTRISVKTGVGFTEEADVGEVIGQGTVGGALASQVNIDKGVDRYFRGSCVDTNYGTVRLQPIIFQDDC